MALPPLRRCIQSKPIITLTRNASFIADGYWTTSMNYVKTAVSQGKKTYVTVQFGHNDQKIAGPEAMAANLVKMVDEM